MTNNCSAKRVEELQVVSYEELLQYGRAILQKSGIEEAEVDSWYLLAFVTDMSRAEFFLRKQDRATQEERQRYEELLALRRQRIPLQHITGEQEFMGLPFWVNQHVLVPRQDTETLVESALPFVEGKRVLDMCTGSGCIAVSLMHYGKPYSCHAVDVSQEALKTAKKNAMRNQADISFIKSDLFAEVSGNFDVIVSNPPYIPPKVIETLSPEVKEFEPRLALDGGEDGLDFYRKITQDATVYLAEGGYLFYEIGYEQAEQVMSIMRDAGFTEVFCKKDYAGNDRVVYGRYQDQGASLV